MAAFFFALDCIVKCAIPAIPFHSQVDQCSRKSMEKGCHNYQAFRCKPMRRLPSGVIGLYSASPEGEAFICGSAVGKLDGAASWKIHLLQVYFLDCELGHTGQACTVCQWLMAMSWLFCIQGFHGSTAC